jgi:hypothetical protein
VFILANSVWSRSDSKLPWAADQSLPEPALLTLVLEGIFGAMFSNHAEALLEQGSGAFRIYGVWPDMRWMVWARTVCGCGHTTVIM